MRKRSGRIPPLAKACRASCKPAAKDAASTAVPDTISASALWLERSANSSPVITVVKPVMRSPSTAIHLLWVPGAT